MSVKATTRLRFVQQDVELSKRSTSVHLVYSANLDYFLGRIQWRNGWRRYTFLPEVDTTFDSGCLVEIITFIDGLMDQRRLPKASKNNRWVDLAHAEYMESSGKYEGDE